MGITISRRKFIKKLMATYFSVVAINALFYYYSKNIETRRINITQIPIFNKKIPVEFNGFRILQFSDTHLGFQYSINQLKKHLLLMKQLSPHLILFTGDLMDVPNQYDHIDHLSSYLTDLHAPFGKIGIYGNHDHGGYGTDIYRKVMNKSGFRLLKNEGIDISTASGASIHIAGLDDAMLGTPNIQKALRNEKKGQFTILLSHAPDLADAVSVEGADLQLSGHSHGGQIKLPFYGPVVTPPYARKYIEGMYHINQKYPLTLYVNRGLGTTRLPFRFLSIPEISLFTLYTSSP
ncbi:metallophosphoesterase [Falsibacillus albus]|uniref:Metallophosphoesterase n=1 Tax=Falsibacillus albus TaxID=2478915 RepID=A0A3L7JLT0_9BACI|nr:metallophosphoesterase [Falsibacillus albus]RLQ90601.1 metallophosphoesterase [Falsibacillus albus]